MERDREMEEVDRTHLGNRLDMAVNTEFSSLGKGVDDGLSPREGVVWRGGFGIGRAVLSLVYLGV